MSQPSTPPSVYQLRVVLRGISPLIWRRLLVRRDTTLAPLHDILQRVFHWSDEHLHSFHIHGRAYGSRGAQPYRVLLSDLCRHRGERFGYVDDFGAHWVGDLRLEAILLPAPRRVYPVCLAGKGIVKLLRLRRSSGKRVPLLNPPHPLGGPLCTRYFGPTLHRFFISRRYADADSRCRLGRKCWAMGP